MDDSEPMISVITVVRNHRKGVEVTYESLKRQTYIWWEMIVIDGHSSDGTLEYLADISREDQRVKVYRQNGLGVYAAMNQGLDLSNSESVWFMNAGDAFFSNDSLELGIRAFLKDNLSLLIGDYSLDPKAKFINNQITSFQISSLDILFGRRGACHQSMIFLRSALVKVGAYSLDYKIASDYDAILRIHLLGKVNRIHLTLSQIEGDGISDRNLCQMYLEKFLIRRKHFPKKKWIVVLNYLWTLAAIAKYLQRQAH
jgi:glycosyltransferase involved in cell wall biosynthesis